MNSHDNRKPSSLVSDYIIGKSDARTIDIEKQCEKISTRKSKLIKLSVVFFMISAISLFLDHISRSKDFVNKLDHLDFLTMLTSTETVQIYLRAGGGFFLLLSLSVLILYFKSYRDFNKLKSEIKNHWRKVQSEAIQSWFCPVVQGNTYLWKDLFLELGGDEVALKMLVSAGIVLPSTGEISKDAFVKLEPIIKEVGGLEVFIEQSSINGRHDDVRAFLGAMKQTSIVPIEECDLKYDFENIDIKKSALTRGGVHVFDELAQSIFDCGSVVPVVALVKIPTYIKQRRRLYTYMSKVFVNKSQANMRTNLEFTCDVVLPTAGKIIGGTVGSYIGFTAGTAAAGYFAKEVIDKGSKVAAVGGAAGVAGAASGAMGIVLAVAPYALAGGVAIAGGIYLGRVFKKIGQKIKLWHFEKAQKNFIKALEDFYADQVGIYQSNDEASPIKSLGLIKRLHLQLSILKEALDGDFKEHDKSLENLNNIFGNMDYEHPVVVILKSERNFSKERLLEFDAELRKHNSTYKKNMHVKMTDINLGIKLYSETQRVTEFNKNELVYQRLKIAEENYSKEIILLEKEYGNQAFKKTA